MNITLTENAQKVLNVINSGTKVYVDDHVKYKVEEDTLEAYVILDNGKICPVFKRNVCSLNPLYISLEDGRLHLTDWATGNIIDTRPYASLKDAIDNYNNLTGEYGNKIIDFKEL